MVVVVPPAETERVTREAAEAGTPRVAESEGAMRFCEESRAAG